MTSIKQAAGTLLFESWAGLDGLWTEVFLHIGARRNPGNPGMAILRLGQNHFIFTLLRGPGLPMSEEAI
jgi:hypothetical protein